jgi:hypothetical protein
VYRYKLLEVKVPLISLANSEFPVTTEGIIGKLDT